MYELEIKIYLFTDMDFCAQINDITLSILVYLYRGNFKKNNCGIAHVQQYP